MPVSQHDILKTILLQELDRMEPETSTFEDDPNILFTIHGQSL